MQDHKQRFLFPDSDIRGELVQVESSVSRILEGHSYPLPVQGLIGEAVAAVAPSVLPLAWNSTEFAVTYVVLPSTHTSKHAQLLVIITTALYFAHTHT